MNIVALFETFVNDLLKAEERFFENPKEFGELEKATKILSMVYLCRQGPCH